LSFIEQTPFLLMLLNNTVHANSNEKKRIKNKMNNNKYKEKEYHT